MLNDLIIDNTAIKPGERKIIMLKMPKLHDWTPLSIPVHVYRSKKPGPTLSVTAAVHGDEVNGIEIIRRLLKKPALKRISGTLIVIPIVNIFGFLHQNRYLLDRRDLNRSFPGSQKGSLAARLAYLISTEIINKSTHIIDLHAGSLHRTNLPQIRGDFDDPTIEKLAKAFNVPVILHSALRDGSMRQYASENSIPFLLYEAGEALRFDELSIKTGVNGILNVMQELGMIIRKKPNLRKYQPTFSKSSYWLRAPDSGIFQPFKTLGKRVKEGDLLASIGNPMTTEEHKLYSPISGIIIGQNKSPVVHEGAALFNIACFEESELVAKQIEHLQYMYSDNDLETN